MSTNLIGFITGILFGMIMQRAQVIRYDRQINVLLFKDMTVLKFMLSAIVVGMVGLYMLKDAGAVHLSVKTTVVGAVIIGGLLFGAGWALVGYCPATSLGALGEGRIDAFWGIAGMLTGAAMFSHIYPFLKKTVLTWGDLGAITVPQALHVNHWVIIPVFIIVVLALFMILENG